MAKDIKIKMGDQTYKLSDIAYIETIGADGEKILWMPEDETRTLGLFVHAAGTYKPYRSYAGFHRVDVESIDPDPNRALGVLEVTENGIYRAATDPNGPFFGYSKVIVNVG